MLVSRKSSLDCRIKHIRDVCIKQLMVAPEPWIIIINFKICLADAVQVDISYIVWLVTCLFLKVGEIKNLSVRIQTELCRYCMVFEKSTVFG